MPKLPKDDVPAVKLDSAAAFVEASLTREQKRGLFEAPGTRVVAIIELTSVTYTGHATSEDKDPQVKLRATLCETASSAEETTALREAMRAMHRKRMIDGTLDEVGPGPHNAVAIFDEKFADYPTEAEYKAHQAQQEAKRRAEFVR